MFRLKKKFNVYVFPILFPSRSCKSIIVVVMHSTKVLIFRANIEIHFLTYGLDMREKILLPYSSIYTAIVMYYYYYYYAYIYRVLEYKEIKMTKCYIIISQGKFW